ncbi:hypothetical protein [Hasllibacter sp. MH4015]|uniref:hypothetical protein n=1 Tax=Hasllibacter sp. MH4015 TaxID=2854029 RepID=UPI001CD2A7C6|nr:hypothetical protein [Hasllibacter sp. MH4015]
MTKKLVALAVAAAIPLFATTSLQAQTPFEDLLSRAAERAVAQPTLYGPGEASALTGREFQMALQPGTYSPARYGRDQIVERVTLGASPQIHTCRHISRGDGRREEVDCLHYLFPDGFVGPLGLEDDSVHGFSFATAPMVEIEVRSAINTVSCLGLGEACRMTDYFQIEE